MEDRRLTPATRRLCTNPGETSVNPSETLAPPADSLRLGALNLDEIQAVRRSEDSSFSRAPCQGVGRLRRRRFPRARELWRRTTSLFKWIRCGHREPHPTVKTVDACGRASRRAGTRRALGTPGPAGFERDLIERDADLEKRGVIVMPIADAARQIRAGGEVLGQTVRPDEPVTALAAALLQGGAFVYVRTA